MINVTVWLSLPEDIKQKIAGILDIKKTGFTHVQDGQVVSDGYAPRDLMGITPEKMRKYLGSKETDLYALWGELVKKVTEEVEAARPRELKAEDPDPVTIERSDDGGMKISIVPKRKQ